MTREEAIARLEANRGAFVFKETNEALDMAIEALSDEQKEGGDAEMQTIAKTPDYMQQSRHDDGKDLISRADAINAVHKYFVDKINNEPHEIDEDGDDVFTDMKSVNALFHHNKMVSKAIKALPSADVVSREDYYNLLMASNDIDRALREYQAKEEADADRQKGEWKWTHGGQCSECGFHNTNFDFNFCPNCGADMRPKK